MTTHADVGAGRDPEFIRAHMEKLGAWVDGYHQTEVEGLELVPEGGALAVGNHNGGIMSPDMLALMVAWWRYFGVDSPAYGLAHDIPFRIPLLRDLMLRAGAVPASQENAVTLLRRGAKVLVYPGGDLDAYRPASEAGKVVFGSRRGFIRAALRAGVPVSPIVSAGAHEAFHVLTDSRELVRRLGLKRLSRVEVLPVVLCLPWGLSVGPMPYLPVPVRIRLRVLPPIAWDYPPEAADDDAIVSRCRDEVVAAMQAGLDTLTREGGHGRRARLLG